MPAIPVPEHGKDGRRVFEDPAVLESSTTAVCTVQVQDYLLWCSQQVGSMSVEESISDVATANLQLAQHQQLWAEIEAREETYQQAVDMGEELQSQDRRNRKEVRRRVIETEVAGGKACKRALVLVLQVLKKLDHLQAERDRLEKQWSQKQSWLEGVLLEQVFYRDVDNMDRISSSQEVHQRSSVLQRTVRPYC